MKKSELRLSKRYSFAKPILVAARSSVPAFESINEQGSIVTPNASNLFIDTNEKIFLEGIAIYSKGNVGPTVSDTILPIFINGKVLLRDRIPTEEFDLIIDGETGTPAGSPNFAFIFKDNYCKINEVTDSVILNFIAYHKSPDKNFSGTGSLRLEIIYYYRKILANV